MSYNSSNYTKFGMKNGVERYAYAVWLLFVVLCSLLGDTTIIVASIKYRAIQIHKIVVVFIQHIVVCDLFDSVFNLLPAIVSLIRDSRGSSKIASYAGFFLHYYVNTVNPVIIAAMTLGKLLLLKYPLKTGSWSTRQAHKVCTGIWIASLFIPALHLLIDKDEAVFDLRVHVSTYMYTGSEWHILLPLVALVASSLQM